MRVAIITDIHGNLPALEATLLHVHQQAPDLVIIAGDVVNGSPDSGDCWRLACSLGCPILRGNHERYAALYGTPQAAPEWATELFAPLHWTVAQLTGMERQAMGALPLQWRSPDAPGLLVVHASARDDHDSIAAHTPVEHLEAMFAGTPERFIVRGHNHNAQIRLWRDGWIVTAGSVGLPLDSSPTVKYLLLDGTKEGWKIQHQSVPYDHPAAVRRFHETGYLAATGPIGRLFYREVLTASFHIVPFLRCYREWEEEEGLSLLQAEERFLNGWG
jgi:predicted phosphodiesterase